MKYSDYLANLRETWWTWAGTRATGQLNGNKSSSRPPVFTKDFADHNIITPDDAANTRNTIKLIPRRQRHRHFGSMRSSQALAQSVFGGLVVAHRLDLLERITADCGQPAFGMCPANAEAEFEFEVDWLGEPRRTSVDVLFRTPEYRVSVECKFTEQDFGQCSRPALKPGKPSYEKQFCNGDYMHQLGRASRCSLTEIGVTYWDHVPQLFNWSVSTDHAPCPIRKNYQLVRNAIAACSRIDKTADPLLGHVLVVYDQRNPEFTPGGAAYAQFVATSNTAVDKGLLRKVSWQSLVEVISKEPEFDWLVHGLRDRHRITAC